MILTLDLRIAITNCHTTLLVVMIMHHYTHILVAKGSKVQEIYRRTLFIEDLNPHCDLDLEGHDFDHDYFRNYSNNVHKV